MFIRWPSFGREKLPRSDAELEGLVRTLRQDVEVLAGQIGPRCLLNRPEKLAEAAHYIQTRLESLGYRVDRQKYSAWGHEAVNLAVQCFGGSRPDQIVLIGAHYDTVAQSPGADDNATGVAALLALAERVVHAQPSRTIRLVAFANEEPPFFQSEAMGSWVYARACRKRADRIVAMLCLESIGYYTDRPESQLYPPPVEGIGPKVGNFVAFISDERSEMLLRHVGRLFEQAEAFPWAAAALPAEIPGISFSDHWAFGEQGYQALMVTDTALYRNPYYHTAEDTPEKIDWDRTARVVRGLRIVIQHLADGIESGR